MVTDGAGQLDWADTADQASFRDAVRRFVRERAPARYRDQADEEWAPSPRYESWQFDLVCGDAEASGAAREWTEALAERGWGAPHWPPEYGGAGLTPVEQFILNQELALAGLPVVGGPGVQMLGPTIMVHGTEEQKRRFLPPTLAGEMAWAQGYSEPGAGSDLASLSTRAVRDADDYVITGQKIWTSMGHMANWLFMLVRTDTEAPKHRGISFVLLPLDSPGVDIRPLISAGWEHRTNESFYDAVRVPVSHRIGEENRGWYVAMTLLDHERSNVGGAVAQRKNVEQLVRYVGSDEGRLRSRVAEFDSVRQKIVQHYVETEVMAQFSFRIISLQIAGQIPNYEASMASAFGSTFSQEFQQTGIKAFGLYGTIWSNPDGAPAYAPLDGRFTQNSVDMISASIAGGTREIQRNIVATRGLGLPRG